MNRAILCRARAVFSRVTVDDIGDAVGAGLIFAAVAVGLWVLAGLGLAQDSHQLVGVAR